MNSFFPLARPLPLSEIARLAGATIPEGAASDRVFTGVGPLETAGSDQVSFLDNAQYVSQAAATGAGVVITGQRHAEKIAKTAVVLVAKEPYRAFATVAATLFPSAMRPQPIFGAQGIAVGAFVHPDAKLEQGVVVDPGVVIGAGAQIGADTVICANAVIGPGVSIGRNSAIGANATITHAHIGNSVIVHPNCNIGQDGFGFAMGPQGHAKVPQVGRVIIQDDVEIGAGCCIDRGMNRDTVIGEGTKIDNMVQIAHNVVIGRHCVVVSQVGLAGSCVLKDFVVIGGQAGVIGHATVGMGAQIAATSSVARDVPAGERWGGTPAKPIRDLFKEMAVIDRLARGNVRDNKAADGTPLKSNT